MGWQIQRPKYSNRPSVYTGGKPTVTWVPETGYPLFPTRRAAVRAYLESVNKELKGAPDDFLQMHWQTPLYRGIVRVVKVA